MTLAPGDRLGPYEILQPIGEGGMGAVYRAKDTRLGRTVAIKVAQAEFHEGFEREARAVAALNHPNICTLHDVGPNYLVMEHVEGPTLGEVIAKGPMAVEATMRIARQIAEALEAAHERGIIHRDLKPDNVKLTADGSVKVLDFGLAKAAEAAQVVQDPANTPTLRASASLAGMIVGTPAYMSPEQAAGKPVDKRTDIWAFGVLVWELLTGKRMFEGETASHVLASVLTQTPDIAAAPAELRGLLSRCLVKDAKLRMRDIGEARLALDGPSQTAQQPAPLPASPWIRWAFAAASFACLILAGLLWRQMRPVEKPLQIAIEDLGDAPQTDRRMLVLSPDGLRMAYVGLKGAEPVLMVRRFEQDQAVALEGTEGASFPAFSPDGNWLLFGAKGKLRKIPSAGGAVVNLADAPAFRGASWGDDGQIVAALSLAAPLVRIPASGGAPQPLTSKEKTGSHRFPQVLPGSKAVLFSMDDSSQLPDVAIQRMDGKDAEVLFKGGAFPRLLTAGTSSYVCFYRGGALHAMPFDITALKATGPPFRVLDAVRWTPANRSVSVDMARDGTLVYAKAVPAVPLQAIWVNRRGEEEKTMVAAGMYTPFYSISPDGTRAAFVRQSGDASEVWVYELANGRGTRISYTKGRNLAPIWSPDSRHIVYRGDAGVYWVRSDGVGAENPHRISDVPYVSGTISQDGKQLVMGVLRTGVVRCILSGDPDKPVASKPEVLVSANAGVFGAEVSRDGKWLAYGSDEASDGALQVHVISLQGKAGKWQVSTSNGAVPRWSPKANELFFENNEGRMMVLSYSVEKDAFVPGKPEPWNSYRFENYMRWGPPTDGTRFLVMKPVTETRPDNRAFILRNFGDEVRRIAVQGQ
ncbi:MAG: protein kinase [Bryobacteraceae bacterium]